MSLYLENLQVSECVGYAFGTGATVVGSCKFLCLVSWSYINVHNYVSCLWKFDSVKISEMYLGRAVEC